MAGGAHRRWSVQVIALASLLWAQHASDVKRIEGVRVLTQDDFAELVQDGKGDRPWFIQFYAPWCGHCKHLQPEYDMLPDMVGDKVSIAKVDAVEQKALAEEFEITGFPSLKLIANGLVYPYQGGRTAEVMAEWLRGDWKNSSGERLPKDRTFVDLAKIALDEYMSSVVQVLRFVPLLLPLMLFVGVCIGFLIAFVVGICLKGTARPVPARRVEGVAKPPEEKKKD
eukprot:TRINITY_DN52070_c0_g1_i1.p1 TRINITY_DN52070_c0_g1~~TRINITY_DN52070_c0_g1_i1.p1  ORF type:complete len:245 (+),score=45.03 TRINITY_DN52070_c0_g1_i1:58-735(+)